ncbi:MAG: response regulator transcription factor [Deinococcales bacterium]
MRGERLLLVEDDRDIARVVELHIADLGYEVVWTPSGEEGLELALSGRFALVVLDLMLPDLDGLELCRTLRARRPEVLVLMLTARSSELDRVVGLELGADDYLGKPFGVRELQARIKALLRRQRDALQSEREPESVQVGELEIDVRAREVRLAGEPVHLTAREFDLLLQFARNPGRVYSRTQLLDLVWGQGFDGFEHTVNSHINRLRGTIEPDPGRPRYIHTVWGVGYKLVAPEA